jgi:hypothetical protein
MALTKGIIIADTKFEFGLDTDGTLTLMDEVLTPDSSRYWPQESYQEGINPPSYDKQFVRDWLEHVRGGWQTLEQNAPRSARAQRGDCQNRRQVPGSLGAFDRCLMACSVACVADLQAVHAAQFAQLARQVEQ